MLPLNVALTLQAVHVVDGPEHVEQLLSQATHELFESKVPASQVQELSACSVLPLTQVRQLLMPYVPLLHVAHAEWQMFVLKVNSSRE